MAPWSALRCSPPGGTLPRPPSATVWSASGATGYARRARARPTSSAPCSPTAAGSRAWCFRRALLGRRSVAPVERRAGPQAPVTGPYRARLRTVAARHLRDDRRGVPGRVPSLTSENPERRVRAQGRRPPAPDEAAKARDRHPCAQDAPPGAADRRLRRDMRRRNSGFSDGRQATVFNPHRAATARQGGRGTGARPAGRPR